ncbi:MAG TPA: peptidylprolyl isomerase [Gemmataceae bacterium]|jgi:peptidyl-prolyl cis-trans isomerase C|nr:peptidylprolyl isomerase [Gemmataceae bacterium]
MIGRNSVLIGLAVAVVAPSAPAQIFGNAPVAIVNGEPIPRSLFDDAFKARPPVVTPLTAAQQRQIKEAIVALLVDETLVRQFLKKNAPPVEPAEIAKQMESLQKGLESQGKTVAEYFKETKQTEAQVRANITLMLQWNAYAAQKVTPAELKKYYADFKDFFDKTTVRASHIVLRIAPDATPADRDAARKKLADLRQEITSGKITFAEAAMKHSECPSAPKGGDLGFFPRKWMVEEPFAKVAFAMKVGELSDVVITDYGYHLIQVTDRKPGDATTFEDAQDEVRDCYIEEMKLAILADLRKSAKIEIKLP